MNLRGGRDPPPPRVRIRVSRPPGRRSVTGDIYIAGSNLNQAMHGDRVVARIERVTRSRRRGRILRILERGAATIVGRFDADEIGHGLRRAVRSAADDGRSDPPGEEGGAKSGDMVSASITRWPTPTRGAIGRVVEVLGDIDEPGVDTEIIIRKHGIPDAHGEEAIAKRAGSAASVREGHRAAAPTSAIGSTVTIDGEHARDFDDAITIERLPNGNYWLGVHIADVAHYVPEGGALDEEAYERGTSVYFPNAPCTCSRRSSRPACAA